MVVSDANIHNIMGGMESTAGVRLHNHRRKLKQRFDIIKKLGQGTYGKVQLGINKETGQEVAIKTIKKAKIETEADLVRIRREIQIMSSVQHPNIIHIYEVFENREKMVLVMEYAAGGELYDYLSERKVLAQEEARRIFRQISTAVYYCHKHKICHRDLKLENILLDEHGSAKIADFGLSNVFDEQRLLSTFCGSPLYASPEIVKGTPYHGPEVDCWSLGVLLYTLVYGAMPFDGSNFKRLVKQISQGDYFEPKKPSPASPLIRDMLTVVPARRADIEKICAHWWVNEGHTESCLEIAEELAGQTPVRLDLLLSLAPPGPGVGSEKLLVTKEQGSNNTSSGGTLAPARCHSVGSLMDLDRPVTELRLQGFDKEKRRGSGSGETPKRKLEEGVSSEEANQGGAKRKERSRRRERERSLDRRQHRSSSRNKQTVETSVELKKESNNTVSQESMDVDIEISASTLHEGEQSLRESEETIVSLLEAVASSVETINSNSAVNEVMQKSSEVLPIAKKSVKKKNKPVAEPEVSAEDSEVQKIQKTIDEPTSETVPSGETTGEVKVKVKRKIPGVGIKKVEDYTEATINQEEGDLRSQTNGIINVNSSHKPKVVEVSSVAAGKTCVLQTNISLDGASKPIEVPKKTGVKTRKSKGDLSLCKLGSSSEKSSGTSTPEDATSPPSRPVERRRSNIFETAEKFNNLLAGSVEPKSPTTEKPKKMFIPGVKVSDAKRAFERKSSLPDTYISAQLKTPALKKTAETNNEGSVIQNCEPNSVKISDTKLIKDIEETETLIDTLKNEQSSNTSQVQLESKIDRVVNNITDEMISHNLIQEETDLQLVPALQVTGKTAQQEEARIKKLKNAVEIISNAIAEENRKETFPDMNKKPNTAKPPVPTTADFKARLKGVGGASPSPNSPPLSPMDSLAGKKTVRVQVAPNKVRLATIEVGGSEATKFPFCESAVNNLKSEKGGIESAIVEETKQSDNIAPGISDSGIVENSKSVSVEDGIGKKKLAKVEITLKSATLPRRKTSKAEIQLGSPRGSDTVPLVGFKTEVEHMVAGVAPVRLPTQRSEVAFPIAAAAPLRSASLEPESTSSKPRERIIPIRVEGNAGPTPVIPGLPPARPPVPPLQQQRSLSHSQRSGSLSRQSTQDSDTDAGPEPIRKSPREYIIPIAVEGGGYITPRAGSLEPSASDEANYRPKHRSTGLIGRPRRMSSLLSDASEDEGFNSPFASLQRHSSLGRDDNTDDDRSFHMHRLRSSRPSRHTLERNDSLSSAEEEDDDDDDDGFEILTAESLFSTLLSRVRSLTQRLNVEDSPRPGFPTSRLMNQLTNMGHVTPSSLWNQEEPLSSFRLASREKRMTRFRRLSESSQFSRSFTRDGDLGSTPWRRSTSRDMSDCDSVYSESGSTTSTLPHTSVRVTVHVPGGRGRGGSGGEPRHNTTATY